MLLGFEDSFLALRCAQYVHLALSRFDGFIKVLVLTVFVAIVAASLAHVLWFF